MSRSARSGRAVPKTELGGSIPGAGGARPATGTPATPSATPTPASSAGATLNRNSRRAINRARAALEAGRTAEAQAILSRVASATTAPATRNPNPTTPARAATAPRSAAPTTGRPQSPQQNQPQNQQQNQRPQNSQRQQRSGSEVVLIPGTTSGIGQARIDGTSLAIFLKMLGEEDCNMLTPDDLYHLARQAAIAGSCLKYMLHANREGTLVIPATIDGAAQEIIRQVTEASDGPSFRQWAADVIMASQNAPQSQSQQRQQQQPQPKQLSEAQQREQLRQQQLGNGRNNNNNNHNNNSRKPATTAPARTNRTPVGV
jgi:hypothetical protein